MTAGAMVSLTFLTAFRTPKSSNGCQLDGIDHTKSGREGCSELTLATPHGLVTIAELVSLVLAWILTVSMFKCRAGGQQGP